MTAGRHPALHAPSSISRRDSARMDRRQVLVAAGTMALAGPGPVLGQTTPPSPPAAMKSDGIPTVLLEAKPAFAELQAGAVTDVWAFGGRAPGPELRLRRGEEFRARLVNGLEKPLSLHWHGLRLPNDTDGVAGLTQDPVAAGGTADLRFVPTEPGTAIYRPLVPGLSGEFADRGLSGVAVVEETAPPPTDLDHVVAVDDWRLGEDGQVAAFGDVLERAGLGRLGNLLTVNGMRAPQTLTIQPGSRIRLRLANLCNARVLRIRFDGVKAFVIAVDGQPTDTFEPLRSTLPFAPGTRYDVMFDAPAHGATASLVALLGAGLPLLEIKADSAAAPRREGALPPIAALPENKALPGAVQLQRAQRHDLVIEGGARPGPGGALAYQGDPAKIWKLNGTAGPVAGERWGKPLFSVRRGTPVVLAIANRTAFTQVMHLNGQCFRLLHALDDGWEPYWLDTLILPEGQVSRIAFVPEARGRWLVASTVLERFDTGLAGWYEVS